VKILEFIFIDFWHWLGTMTILYVTLHFIVSFLNNFMYYRTVRRVGYPPCASNRESSPIKEEEVEEVNEQNTSNR
jgi:hypothetical protein